MAANAVSYGREDGIVFWEQGPPVKKKSSVSIPFPVEGRLDPGILFIPDTMEHKWAIYFDGESIRFVRSWQRQVMVVAKVVQQGNVLTVVEIMGQFMEDEAPEFTASVLTFLLMSHSLREIFPAPLPKELEGDTNKAALWAFAAYGKMAQVGSFVLGLQARPVRPLRTLSLLHIAVIRNDWKSIVAYVRKGYAIDGLAGDGLAPLHWALTVEAMQTLLKLGADPDARSAEGATPMMKVVEADRLELFQLLLAAGANVDARDDQGITALHLAAEAGHIRMVEALLRAGADKSVSVKDHTPLSLARAMGHSAIVGLLS